MKYKFDIKENKKSLIKITPIFVGILKAVIIRDEKGAEESFTITFEEVVYDCSVVFLCDSVQYVNPDLLSVQHHLPVRSDLQ